VRVCICYISQIWLDENHENNKNNCRHADITTTTADIVNTADITASALQLLVRIFSWA
jgi:hypothetical protein